MKKPTPSMSLRTFVLITYLLIPACSENTAEKGKAPPAFSQAHSSEVTPMVDGSAYVSDADSRLWYVRGNQAVRVRLPDAHTELPKSFEIAPAVDGSAYLTDTVGDRGLWHLIRERAERVVEVEAMVYSHQPSRIPDKGYALYLAERKRRKQAQQDAASPPEPEPEQDYESDF
jgi:hypothetical protein